ALVEDRIVPMSLPVRDAFEAARKKLGGAIGTAQPVVLFWMGLDEPGRLIEAMLADHGRLGYRGAVLGALGGGHLPERTVEIVLRLASLVPTVVSPRAGGGAMLRHTYGGPSGEIALRQAGLIWGGRLHPLKAHPTRLNAFASPQTGPVAALVEDRIVPMSLPVRDAIEAARRRLGGASGAAQAVALFWMGLDESGRLIEAMLADRERLGYRGAVLGALGGGHLPERTVEIVLRLATAIPTVISPRAGGGAMLRHTYGGPSGEIALRQADLIWGGRLHPVKARVLLETCLRAGLGRDAIAEVFDGFG
ncbi:MAG TPA: hypothetical protein VE963_06770, partial [Reyranella sp.]|nr:hypothetical protein [Reyranella sp.]